MEYNGHYYKLVLQRNFIDCTAKLLYVSFVESIKLATDAVDQYTILSYNLQIPHWISLYCI